MKTVKLIFSALLMVVSVAATAGTGTHGDGKKAKKAAKAEVLKGSAAGIYKVHYHGENSGKVMVSIYQANGTLVMRESIRKYNAFVRPYNFNRLAAGTYRVEVADQNGLLYSDVIKHGVATTPAKKEAVVYSTVSKLAGDDQKFMMMAFTDVDKKLLVKIYDEDNALVFSKVEWVEGDFSQVYNLGAIVSDTYTFEVSEYGGDLVTVQFFTR